MHLSGGLRRARRAAGRRTILLERVGAKTDRFFFPHAVHGLDAVVARLLARALAQRGEIELAVGVVDQDLEQERMGAAALGSAGAEQADDVIEVLQPVAGLGL